MWLLIEALDFLSKAERVHQIVADVETKCSDSCHTITPCLLPPPMELSGSGSGKSLQVETLTFDEHAQLRLFHILARLATTTSVATCMQQNHPGFLQTRKMACASQVILNNLPKLDAYFESDKHPNYSRLFSSEAWLLVNWWPSYTVEHAGLQRGGQRRCSFRVPIDLDCCSFQVSGTFSRTSTSSILQRPCRSPCHLSTLPDVRTSRSLQTSAAVAVRALKPLTVRSLTPRPSTSATEGIVRSDGF